MMNFHFNLIYLYSASCLVLTLCSNNSSISHDIDLSVFYTHVKPLCFKNSSLLDGLTFVFLAQWRTQTDLKRFGSDSSSPINTNFPLADVAVERVVVPINIQIRVTMCAGERHRIAFMVMITYSASFVRK